MTHAIRVEFSIYWGGQKVKMNKLSNRNEKSIKNMNITFKVSDEKKLITLNLDQLQSLNINLLSLIFTLRI